MSITTSADAAAKSGSIDVFTFGDDVSVIDGREAWGYFDGIYRTAHWYEPPVPMLALAKAYRVAAHHQSAIRLKLNLLRKHFVPSRWMDSRTHERAALDMLQMGNTYFETIPNLGGRPLRFEVSPALHTRVGVEEGEYYWVKPDMLGLGSLTHGYHKFEPGRITHLLEPDTAQEVYGIPEWLSALNSALLNEAATLFRRRYFKNGAHAGFVFYNRAAITEQANEQIKEQIRQAKGAGNFRNLYIHQPDGEKDAIQIHHIAEVSAKDEFMGIKNVTRDDMLAAHRVPPQLLGIIPQNNGGFGDIRSAADIFFIQEVMPLMERMLELNEAVGLEVIRYREYEPTMPANEGQRART